MPNNFLSSFRRNRPFSYLLFPTIVTALTACGPGHGGFSQITGSSSQSSKSSDGVVPAPSTPVSSNTPTPTPSSGIIPIPTPVSAPSIIPDESITLDAMGETFQQQITSSLQNSRYMETNCHSVTQWQNWQNFPMNWCRYTSGGQTTEVLLLDPGPRRLTLWIEDACTSFAKNVSTCMTTTYNRILDASGGQFPVAGVVVEDMDGNGKGNAYAFRNGVTVSISAFAVGTESLVTATQTASSFTQIPLKTYTYARPVSATRDDLTSYGKSQGLSLPDLGTSSQELNIYNQIVGTLYQQAWTSAQNHIIRAWVAGQNL